MKYISQLKSLHIYLKERHPLPSTYEINSDHLNIHKSNFKAGISLAKQLTLERFSVTISGAGFGRSVSAWLRGYPNNSDGVDKNL